VKINLYNEDGSLHSNALDLLNCKPDNISMVEWIKAQKKFRSNLSLEDSREFGRLRQRKHQAKYRKNNPEKIKQRNAKYYAKNIEKERKRSAEKYINNPNYRKSKREYYSKNPEKVKQKNLKWKMNNLEKLKQIHKNYRIKNKNKINEYHKKRKAVDPLYRLICGMRSSCCRVVKQLALGKKPTSTFKWMGCSPEKLKIHLENLFSEGMTWENYGKWHIDHIRPISSFKQEEWEQINHYTNLQPLWAEDNLKKSNKYQIDTN
jgi:hypothetical protein